MIIDIVVLLFLALIVFLMVNEGPFSALILLFCSLIASLTAMGYYERAANIFAKWPDMARGVAFLLIFFVLLTSTRTIFDFLVRDDIELPPLPAKIVSGVIGFFVGMVVMGTVLIGIQMLPLTSSIAGYDRYPNGMARSSSAIWFDPDGFVESIWDMTSGNSVGGSPAFAIVHPHLLRELYGLRYTVQFAGRKTLAPSLLKVMAAGTIPADKASLFHIPPMLGKKIVVIRTEVHHGSTQPAVSSDSGYFRLTPSEVRLVTTDGHQYYPVGFLRYGALFQKLTFNSAVVDDYRHVNGHRVVIQNWIFALRPSQKPYFIELKGTARGMIAGAAISKTLAALPMHDYPKLAYENSKLTITVAADAKLGTLVGVAVPAQIRMLKVAGLVQAAYRRLGVISRAITNSQPPWSDASSHTVGTPTAEQAGQWRSMGNQLIANGNSHEEPWWEVLQLLTTSQVSTDTSRSLARERHFFKNQIIPLLNGQEPVNLRLTPGKSTTIKIAPGNWQIILWSIHSSQMYVWSKSASVRIGQSNSVTLGGSDQIVNYNLSK
ncbi:MAG: hypothetical protein ACP5O1_00175 [Phycisphaerae bacterium]